MNQRSLDNLKGVHPDLVRLFEAVDKIHSVVVTEGLRSPERQAMLVASGKSKRPDSKHLTGHAVDVCPSPIDYNDIKRFYFLAGIIKAVAINLGIKMRWGGDWNGNNVFSDQTFNDLVHWELIDV